MGTYLEKQRTSLGRNYRNKRYYSYLLRTYLQDWVRTEFEIFTYSGILTSDLNFHFNCITSWSLSSLLKSKTFIILFFNGILSAHRHFFPNFFFLSFFPPLRLLKSFTVTLHHCLLGWSVFQQTPLTNCRSWSLLFTNHTTVRVPSGPVSRSWSVQ